MKAKSGMTMAHITRITITAAKTIGTMTANGESLRRFL